MKTEQNGKRRWLTSVSVVRRSAAVAAFVVLLVLAPEARVRAQVGPTAPIPLPGHGAPELDPSLLSSGLAILAGGALLLMERRRQR